MKKAYQTPVAEKIQFAYRDQVVVASFWSDECRKYNAYEQKGCTSTSVESGWNY